MPTDKQRREAARRHLERQLQRRQEREAARKKFTLIASVVGTLVLIAIVVVVLINVSSDDKTPAANGSGSPTTPASTAPTAPQCDIGGVGSVVKVVPATGAPVTFNGVTVKGATDLKGEPVVSSKSTKPATKLEYKDLVVGTGPAADPTSCVTVQYSGVLYETGTAFDSSWSHGQPTQFPLTGVVPGFTQGIGGTTGVPAMNIGGRRIVIVPAAMGYGAAGSPPKIPANASLVFVIDLVSTTPQAVSGG